MAQRTRLAALDRTWTEEAKGLDQAVAAALAALTEAERRGVARGWFPSVPGGER